MLKYLPRAPRARSCPKRHLVKLLQHLFLCFAGFHHRRGTVVASTAGDVIVKLSINTKGKGGIILPIKFTRIKEGVLQKLRILCLKETQKVTCEKFLVLNFCSSPQANINL